jgi:hypothetical protein
MLQWSPRLFAILVFAVVAGSAMGWERGFSWW